jgi:hypothetical protein
MKLNKEKYILIEFGLTVIFFAYYLFLTFNYTNGDGEIFSTYFIVVISYTIAVILFVLLLLLVTKSKSVENDERDLFIKSKAYRNGFISAITIINTLIIWILLNDKILEPFIMFNILFSTLFVVHIIQNITQLFYYKRGI